IFRANVEGIVRSIDRLRMIGGGYNSGVTNNLNGDTNWNWANTAHGVGGNCESQGGRALRNGECRMWGNPIAEMLYEGLRYFAGAATPTTRCSSGGSSQGQAEDNRLGLPAPAWRDPYSDTVVDGVTTHTAYPSCARPRSEEHTSELQSRENLVCRLLLEKKKQPALLIARVEPEHRHRHAPAPAPVASLVQRYGSAPPHAAPPPGSSNRPAAADAAARSVV